MIMRNIVIIVMLIIVSKPALSQVSSTVFLESGENSVSSGQYIDLTSKISASIQDWHVETAAGITFSETRENIFNALKIDVSRAFRIKKRPFTTNAFYQWKPFSNRIHEQNAGIILKFLNEKFYYQLGLNTRVFHITKSVVDEQDYENTILWEPINLMYKISYHQALSEKWDFRASITNFDEFIIQQETNPMLITKFLYHLSGSSKIHLDLGYLQSGLMNIRVNYFGYFIRGGVQWVL